MHSSGNKLILILTFLSKVVQRLTKRKIGLDTILKKIIKRQLPFLIGGTITGAIMTYYYGFLFSIIVNSAIWMLISFIVNKYYYKSTGFKDEKYLVQYGLAMINARTRQS
jgi:ABC-type transport system involved in Fe-S cluster assembly fused permease/ATPase subunit